VRFPSTGPPLDVASPSFHIKMSAAQINTVNVAEVPSMSAAMEMDSGSVKVEVGRKVGMHAKLANVLAVIVAGVVAVAVGTVMADGTSVIKLKDPKYLPRLTEEHMIAKGLNMRADELLGPSYGIGLHHDQAGFGWTTAAAGKTLKQLEADLGVPAVIAAVPYVISTDDLKHPVPFLECKGLQMAGLCAVSFGFIAEVVAVLMLIFHTAVLADLIPSATVKPLASLIWFVLATGFLIVILLAVGVYTSVWRCDNTFVSFILLSDHFDYSYGIYFAATGFVSSLLIALVSFFCSSAAPPTKPLAKVGGGMLAGLVFCGIAVVSTLAGTRTFMAKPPVNPNHNPCYGQKPAHAGPGDNYFSNVACMKDTITQTLEQAGANVTKGFKGTLHAADRKPITGAYADHGLCPVNVHWHLGAEHLSVGQFDAKGTGPAHRRELAANARQGLQCHHYKADEAKWTTPFPWEHCVGMEVGQTYEIHWPHSAAGACGTPWQMQTPFYDGVFCKDGIIDIAPLNTYEKIGVQSQTFTIINDEDYFYGDLIKGMMVNTEKKQGWDMAYYTGSTTGTSRDNSVCSRYTPITWQVDRRCHIISASSFDKLCKDMKAQKDDMKDDLYAHGAREVVARDFTATNMIN